MSVFSATTLSLNENRKHVIGKNVAGYVFM